MTPLLFLPALDRRDEAGARPCSPRVHSSPHPPPRPRALGRDGTRFSEAAVRGGPVQPTADLVRRGDQSSNRAPCHTRRGREKVAVRQPDPRSGLWLRSRDRHPALPRAQAALLPGAGRDGRLLSRGPLPECRVARGGLGSPVAVVHDLLHEAHDLGHILADPGQDVRRQDLRATAARPGPSPRGRRPGAHARGPRQPLAPPRPGKHGRAFATLTFRAAMSLWNSSSQNWGSLEKMELSVTSLPRVASSHSESKSLASSSSTCGRATESPVTPRPAPPDPSRSRSAPPGPRAGGARGRDERPSPGAPCSCVRLSTGPTRARRWQAQRRGVSRAPTVTRGGAGRAGVPSCSRTPERSGLRTGGGRCLGDGQSPRPGGRPRGPPGLLVGRHPLKRPPHVPPVTECRP